MSLYKVEINGINTNDLPSLSKEETIKLFNELKNGNTNAKEQLVNSNLKLVLSIINNYIKSNKDLNDLFQIGCIGLIKAIDNFDISYGVTFSTYAVPLILGEIKRYIRDSSTLKISRSIRDLSYHILKYKEHFYNNYGYEPSIEDILKKFNISEYELYEVENSLNTPQSIYDPIYNDGGDTIYLLDQLKDHSFNQDKIDLLLNLKDIINNLKEREKNIIMDRYFYGKTQLELANELNVSQAQISRIETNALNNIRKLLK